MRNTAGGPDDNDLVYATNASGTWAKQVSFTGVSGSTVGDYTALTVGSDGDVHGGSYKIAAGGGFFARELRLSVNATSSVCYDMNITISMFR